MFKLLLLQPRAAHLDFVELRALGVGAYVTSFSFKKEVTKKVNPDVSSGASLLPTAPQPPSGCSCKRPPSWAHERTPKMGLQGQELLPSRSV